MSPRARELRARARAVETRERNARRYARTVARTGRPGMIRDALAFVSIGAALYASISYLPAFAAILERF